MKRVVSISLAWHNIKLLKKGLIEQWPTKPFLLKNNQLFILDLV
jgi:hypothetical protein